MAADAWYPGNTMATSWRIQDESTEEDVTSGITVEARLFDAASGDPIQDEAGDSINPIEMTYSADQEEWQGEAAADADVDEIDAVDIQYLADGGPGLSAEWWDEGVPVTTRDARRG